MRLSWDRWSALGLVLLLSACESKTSVEFTIPFDNQTGVNPRTVVAIRLSNTMSSKDDANTDGRRILVTGDQTEGVYAGTIQKAHHSAVFHGQTIEEFQQRAQTAPGAEEATSAPTGEDTLVFLLETGVRFKAGERVHVFISHDVTVRGVPMERHRGLSFTVAGGAARAEGDFFVVSTTPEPEARTGALNSAIRARFSQPAKTETLAAGISVRGSQSGAHGSLNTLFEQGAMTTLEVTTRLAPQDSFLPGEWVTATWGPQIQQGGTPAAGESPAELASHLLRFQARPGKVHAGWNEVAVPGGAEDIRQLLAANFRPQSDGVEFVLVLPRRLRLYVQAAERAWSQSEVAVPGGFEVKGAAVADINADGVPEVVAVLEGNAGSRLQRYAVNAAGTLETSGAAVEFPARGIRGAFAADLNADGKPEMVVFHESRSFLPAGSAETQSTGFITFFELRQGPQPGEEIDLSDLGAISELRFHRIDRPIPRFELSSRVEAHDFDGDGRLDLIGESAEGLVFYRNQSSSQSLFTFRRVGALMGPGAAPYLPAAWVAVDIDGDHDVDLLTWNETGGWFHENHQPPRQASPAPPSGAPRGILFESLPPVAFDAGVRPASGDSVTASNLDGDELGTADLVIARRGGDIELLLGTGERLGFRRQTLRGEALLGPVALADVDGDSGLDVLAAARTGVRLLLSDDVDAPPLPEPSSFRLVEVSNQGGTLTVAVLGDLRTRFSGYALALDYDEQVIQYLGFEEPAAFQRRASFDLCPNAQLQGCSGRASATMSYLQSSVGAPSTDVELGRFRFRLPQVMRLTETLIELKSFQTAERTFTNLVRVAEGGGTFDVPVTALGPPLEVILMPPPPPALAISCAVEARLASQYRARVSWESPQGLSFAQVRVLVGGADLYTVPWEDGSFAFDDNRGGIIPIQVTALAAGADPQMPPASAPSASCEIVSLFPPVVSCESTPSSNRVTWSYDFPADRFNIYRNGTRIGGLSGSAELFVFDDFFRSPAGGDSYQVAAVIGVTEGPRGGCRGQDLSPCITESPVIISGMLERRTKPADPNLLRFRWRNGEAYDRLVAFLSFTAPGGGAPMDIYAGGKVLDGNDTELLYVGDRDRGGARPGTYRLTLQAFNRRPAGGECPGAPEEIASNPVVFDAVAVPVPGLDGAQFTCERRGISDLRASWLPLWRGYDDFLTLRVKHTIGGQPPQTFEVRDILLGETERVLPRLEPVGAYELSLIAVYEAAELVVSCAALSFTPQVTTGTVETGVGLAVFDLPLRASGVFRAVVAFELELEYPDFVTLLDVASEPAGPGRRKTAISGLDVEIDPDPDGDGQTDGNVVLTRLRARLPHDFSLAGRSPPDVLRVSGARLRFEGAGDWRPVESPPGALVIRGRYVALDRGEVAAGSQDAVRLAIRVTFTAPPQKPDYKFNAFQIHLRFDPAQLTLLPITVEDQAGTAIGGRGLLIYPEDAVLADVNRTGALKLAWLGFNPRRPQELEFLTPVTNRELFVLRFRSRLPATSPERFSAITFVTDSRADQPTAFFPVEDVPGVPDMEAFFHGGIQITQAAGTVVLSGLEPARGALPGGNTVTLRGRGFPTAAGALPRLRFVAPSGARVDVPSEAMTVKSSREIEFVMPDSGVRSLPVVGLGGRTLELETATRVVSLPQAYTYEAPRLTGADVQSVRASGGDFVELRGTGLSVFSSAFFTYDVGGVPETAAAEIFRIAPDGTSLVLVSPPLPEPAAGAELGTAVLRVAVRDREGNAFATLTLSPPLNVLRGGERPPLRISRIEPASASVCGGATITILGEGFGAGASVELGGVRAPSVKLRSSRELEAVVPEAANAGFVRLRVRQDFLTSNEVDFEYLDPPAFIRGDVDGNLLVNITDSVVLSSLLENGAGAFPENRDAMDVNDDGLINFGDVIYLLRYILQGGPPPPPPFPSPGQDPDNLADGICQ
jgi:hypothetical protein